jgi:hypothetical protein
MAVAPGHAHLHAIKILHHDKFLAPRQFVPRHCAGAHLHTFCNRDNFSATYQNYIATHVMLNQLCTRTAKNAPYPFYTPKPWRRRTLHRDSFSAKVPGHNRCCRRVTGHHNRLAPRYPDITCRDLTLGPLYCRAVRFKRGAQTGTSNAQKQEFG